MPRLDGRSALVTGAASGIGAATAALFEGEGCNVLAADLKSSIGGVALDVRSEQDWEQALRGVEELDVLVNCAGIAPASPIADTSFEEWRRVLEVNLDGVFLGTRAAIRRMRRSGGGTIVNLASSAGIDVHPGAAAYAASKAAVIHFSKVAAAECAQDAIRVHVIAPGGVRTPMWQTTPLWPASARDEEAAWREIDPAGSFLTAEEVAAEILDLVLHATTSSVRVLGDRARQSV